MSGRTVTLGEVLARIDAVPIPSADALAEIPLDELERQLRALGVDVDGDLDALLSAAGADGTSPGGVVQDLAAMSAADLAGLSLGQVEACLDAEGVDVREWLSRAESLIRGRARVTDGRTQGGRRTLPGADPAPARRPRPRRVPRALAATLAAVALGVVSFALIDEQGLMAPQGVQDEPVTPAGPEPDPTAQQRKGERPAATTEGRSPAGARIGQEARKLDEAVPRASAPVAPETARKIAPDPVPEAAPEVVTASEAASSAGPAAGLSAPLADAPALVRPELPETETGADTERQTARLQAPRSAAAPSTAQAADAAVPAAALRHDVDAPSGAPPRLAAAPAIDTLLSLAPGEALADGLSRVALDAQDRQTLERLLAPALGSAGGELRLRLHAGRVREAELLQPGRAPVRVTRDRAGALVPTPQPPG